MGILRQGKEIFRGQPWGFEGHIFSHFPRIKGPIFQVPFL